MMTFGSLLTAIDRIPDQADGITRGSVTDLLLVSRKMREAAAKIEVIASCHGEVVQEPRVVPFPRRLRLVDGGTRR